MFVTCLVDLFRPSVGFAAVTLLRRAGCEVVVPAHQTCCGQPAYNSGDYRRARAVARVMVERLEPYADVVVPSGSCAGMLRHHWPRLFEEDTRWRERARAVGGRARELTSLLDEVGTSGGGPLARYPHRVAYHDSCASLRELGVHAEPRRLLDAVEGLERCELDDPESCCGFGGTFCVKYPEISTRMISDKVASLTRSGAHTLAGNDLGCLLHIAGRITRLNHDVRVLHVAELLAGGEARAIGEGERRP